MPKQEYFLCPADVRVPYGKPCPKCGATSNGVCGGLVRALERNLSDAQADNARLRSALETVRATALAEAVAALEALKGRLFPVKLQEAIDAIRALSWEGLKHG